MSPFRGQTIETEIAGIEEGNPRLARPVSHLNEPFETPVFVTGHIGFGGDFDRRPADAADQYL